MLKYVYNLSIGKIFIGQEDEQIVQVSFADFDGKSQETKLMLQVEEQLREYLAGKRKLFNIPISYQGTNFQQKVWQELLKIPYGQTCSYQKIAEKCGNINSVRAVGGAVHNNPLAIIIPCHRVIGKNGKLTGFAAGLKIKKTLLDLEQN